MRNFLRLSVIAAATIIALPVAQALAAPAVPADPVPVKLVQTSSADLPAEGTTAVQYYHHRHRGHWQRPRYHHNFYHHQYRPRGWGHHHHRGHGYGHRHHRHHW